MRLAGRINVGEQVRRPCDEFALRQIQLLLQPVDEARAKNSASRPSSVVVSSLRRLRPPAHFVMRGSRWRYSSVSTQIQFSRDLSDGVRGCRHRCRAAGVAPRSSRAPRVLRVDFGCRLLPGLDLKIQQPEGAFVVRCVARPDIGVH